MDDLMIVMITGLALVLAPMAICLLLDKRAAR
jgi:hypothetical protein